MRSSRFALAVCLSSLVACGDDANTGGAGNGGGSGASSSNGGAGGGTNDGGSTQNNSGGSTVDFMDGGGAQGGGSQGGSCAGEVAVAEPIPLDLYIMLDASGSMTENTGTMGQGVQKWEAITSALDTFFTGADGVGVGLQFFPLKDASVPDTCSTQAQCGTHGPCVLKICDDDGSICVNNSDCGSFGPCVNLGYCQNNPDTLCWPIGGTCPGNQGVCTTLTSSFCLNQDSCVASDYGTPAVPIATLPGVKPSLDTAIAGRDPAGATPTSAALQGAIDYARSYATANPGHVVTAVLATDGIPTECDPLDANGISAIAAQGLAGSPAVRTFVIGIIGGNDQSAENLMNDIADAGGTTEAFLVDPQSQDVEQAFLDALAAIQGSSLACEYFVPQPEPPDTIDYGQVNVEYTPTGGGDPVTIGYVGSAASCDPTTGGWYYDVDPTMGTPTKILVCPATCTVFGTGGEVNIRVGCETVVAVPQ